MLFVFAVTLATDYNITEPNRKMVAKLMNQFVVDYERLYYQYSAERIQACKPVFHALLHVAECIEWLGKNLPSFV